MDCVNYYPKNVQIPSFGSKPVKHIEHRCKILDSDDLQAKVKIQQDLSRENLCNKSFIITFCPIAGKSQTDWKRCPHYKVP